MAELKLISAESVTEGHPDKVCDQISDAILDDMLAQDPHSHVAVETCATVGQFFVFGEVTSEGYSDIQNIVRSVVRNIGYTSSRVGLDADSCGVTVSLTEQSPEINQGVARLSGEEESKASREQRYEAQGAGDQGVMFGYACDETVRSSLSIWWLLTCIRFIWRTVWRIVSPKCARAARCRIFVRMARRR